MFTNHEMTSAIFKSYSKTEYKKSVFLVYVYDVFLEDFLNFSAKGAFFVEYSEKKLVWKFPIKVYYT